MYHSCPDCRTRMKRTGKKENDTQTLNGGWLYIREYECPSCGSIWVFDENHGLFTRGRIS